MRCAAPRRVCASGGAYDGGRARIAAGSVANLEFLLGEAALALVNATGGRQLYAGQHALVFSRGHGPEVAVNVTV